MEPQIASSEQWFVPRPLCRRRMAGPGRLEKKSAAKKIELDPVTFFCHERDLEKLQEMVMPTVTIHSEPWDRDRRLRELSLDYVGLVEVVRAMVSARSDTTINNSQSAPSYYAWDAGVRALREQYCQRGWEKEILNGLETIKHPTLKVRVAPVNADAAVCDPTASPQNRTPKGSVTRQVIDLNGQIDMFTSAPMGKPAADHQGTSIWQLMVYDDGNKVRAELSRPIEFENGYFIAFSERIFLIGPGEWDRLDLPSSDDDEDDLDVDVQRKG